MVSFRRSENKKTRRLPACRVSEEEKNKIEYRAKDCGLSLSEFLIRTALGRQTRTKHDVSVINDLREINQTIRELYRVKEHKPEELRVVLEAVVRAIDRVGQER
jgi:hypothetical protein